jgi:hypothetical protein
MTSTDAGIEIDVSDEHGENADSSRRTSLEFDSNATYESSSHDEKQCSPISSTEAGMQMDASDEHAENAHASKRESVELGSKVTDERSWHDEKQFSPMTPTDEAIQIDESKLSEKAEGSRDET